MRCVRVSGAVTGFHCPHHPLLLTSLAAHHAVGHVISRRLGLRWPCSHTAQVCSGTGLVCHVLRLSTAHLPCCVASLVCILLLPRGSCGGVGGGRRRLRCTWPPRPGTQILSP